MRADSEILIKLPDEFLETNKRKDTIICSE